VRSDQSPQNIVTPQLTCGPDETPSEQEGWQHVPSSFTWPAGQQIPEVHVVLAGQQLSVLPQESGWLHPALS
jgi:hypothetical protein